MDSIVREYDIQLRIVSTPIRDDRKDKVDKFVVGVNNTSDSTVYRYMQKYVESITYYPSELFEDAVHLYDNNVPSNYLKLY